MISLDEAWTRLANVESPEDLFGPLNGDGLKHEFRDWARSIHPDLYTNHSDKEKAQRLFAQFSEWKVKAEKKIADGTYGDRSALGGSITIQSKTEKYVLDKKFKSGDLSDIYVGSHKGDEILVKVVRSPKNNDLANNENHILTYLHSNKETKDLPVMRHVPKLLDSFSLKDGSLRRHVNVLEYYKNFYTLAEVIKAYPSGIDAADAAWMMRRILAALIGTHRAGVVHGAITPDHILVRMPDHNGMLIDWSYAALIKDQKDSPTNKIKDKRLLDFIQPARFNDKIKAINSKYKEFYPPEIYDKERATFGIDMYMLAMCFLKLLGGDVTTQIMPKTVPRAIQGLIKACLLGPKMRSSDVGEFWDDFAEALEKLYGKPKFRPFTMPAN